MGKYNDPLLEKIKAKYKTSTQDELKSGLDRHTNSHVLLVDGMNTFMRCWMALPTLSDNGDHIGGVSGFLKSVGAAIKLLRPTRCIVAFDGEGGSWRRKKIYPQYKNRSSPKMRLNRVDEDFSNLEEEEKNLRIQLVKVTDYLQMLPVNMLLPDSVEADDTIAYCALDEFKDSRVDIMSADKDFLQLVSDRVRVWSPTKKIIYGPAEVLREYGIHPKNFVLYRALDGDKSDNIPGVQGFGLKTALKQFPFLAEDKEYKVEDLISHAKENAKKSKVCQRMVDDPSMLYRNYSLMQLTETYLSSYTQLHVHECLETGKIPHLNRFKISKQLMLDRMNSNIPNHTAWINEVWGPLESAFRNSKA